MSYSNIVYIASVLISSITLSLFATPAVIDFALVAFRLSPTSCRWSGQVCFQTTNVLIKGFDESECWDVGDFFTACIFFNNIC